MVNNKNHEDEQMDKVEKEEKKDTTPNEHDNVKGVEDEYQDAFANDSSKANKKHLNLKKELGEMHQKHKHQEQIIQQQQHKIKNLEMKIHEQNSMFIKKLEEKMKEASSILKQKQEELYNTFDTKLEDAIFKIYKNKFDNLLSNINQFYSITNKEYDDDKLNSFIKGFSMIANGMVESLKELDIHMYTPTLGSIFNGDTAEAFEVVPDNTLPDHSIKSIVNPGFMYKDKIIKYATVKITKKES
ncbi:nucleotide exchange factor GrpE [Ureaplasma canigenitalium]|uniref:nucleotide exchange factor GrpE n=1 Tax=Ureaplasma canigenitalium TaxID=42092 RepID=UPI0004E1C457|nr:nucleotide exchange factor GrpE [Ureaplasma canigenitalium]